VEEVILIDENDHELGVGEKMATHLEGLLHRAFSVVIVSTKGEMLLQKRAIIKYHSGGLWTNACCGHPRPGEGVIEAANRRLMEEMGIACDLKPWFNFAYRADLDHDLVENEYDHVLIGRCDKVEPKPDPDEADDWKWMKLDALNKDIAQYPERYTYWFKILLEAAPKLD
jgi:isopentenyl-diphosphate delta-isomerase